MIALIQRVTKGEVIINNQLHSQVGKGYVILLGVFGDDTEADVEKLVDKIVNLRVIADENGKMNRSILDVGEEILLVSQFTLCADTSYGRRPSFIKAKKPKEAEKLYLLLAKKIQERNISVKTGKFAAYMDVQISNDGPVTIIIDSKKI